MLTLQNHRAVPFSLASPLLAAVDNKHDRRLCDLPHARPITGRVGRAAGSLSDRQSSGNQIRFYTKERAIRGFRYLAAEIADLVGDELTLQLDDLPSAPDVEFLDQLLLAGIRVSLHVDPTGRPELSDQVEQFLTIRTEVTRRVRCSQLIVDLDRLLSCGDSWSALSLVQEHEAVTTDLDARLADRVGLAYALQGFNFQAERAFAVWADQGGVEEARAKYSIAMMYARHHSESIRNADLAGKLLMSAWAVLELQPDSEAVRYERAFNRNGYALLLYRSGSYDEAAQLLTEGIDVVSRSQFKDGLHQTVLLNNLGRVYAKMGRHEEAEHALRRATEIDPQFAEYWQDLASQLADADKWPEALDSARLACDLDPAIPEAHQLRGFVANALGLRDEAILAYSAGARLGSLDSRIGLIGLHSEAANYAQVLRHMDGLDLLATTDDQRVDFELYRIEAMSFLDQTFDATSALRSLRLLYPNSSLVLENIAAITEGEP